MDKNERILFAVKETPKKVVFAENNMSGVPPIFDGVYIPKWAVGNVKTIKITIEEVK